MKRAFLLILTLLLVAGCTIARSSNPNGGPLTGEATTPDGLSLRTRIEHTSWTWGQPAKVTVTVKNGSKEPVPFIRTNGCDSGISVVLLQAEEQVGYFRPDGPEMMCTQALQMASLAPGAEIQATVVWDRNPDQPTPAAGEYTLQVTFNRGANYDARQPLTDNITVQLKN
jgi:hypothetical protein